MVESTEKANGRGNGRATPPDPFSAGSLGPQIRLIAGDGWDTAVGFASPSALGTSRVTAPYRQSIWIRAALKALAEPFSRLPVDLWTNHPDEEGAEQVIETHPLVALWRRPNSFLTGADLLKLHMVGYRSSGATYLFLADRQGQPVGKGQIPLQMVPVARGGVKIEERDAFGLPTLYSYALSVTGSEGGASSPKFPAHAVIPILDHDTSNWTEGFGDVEALSTDIDIYHQALRYISAFVRSGGDPGAWFKFKNTINPAEMDRLQGEIDDDYGTTDTSRYKAVSSDVEQIIPNNVKPRDLEYERLFTFEREAMLSLLGVPPPCIGILDRAILNNMKVCELLMWTGPNGILSTVRRTEDAMNNLFLPRFVGRSRGAARRGTAPSREWCYRFDVSDVEVLQKDISKELLDAIGAAAKGAGISLAEIVRMLKLEIELPEEEEESGAFQPWIAKNLRPAEDRAGDTVAQTLAALASQVAARTLPVESAVAIAVATLPGTVDEAAARAMFPEPPEPEPAPEPIAGPEDEDEQGGGDERNPVASGPGEEEALALHSRYRLSAFEPGKPITPDRALKTIAEEWLADYQRETLKLWRSVAADEEENALRVHRRLDVDRPATDSLVLAKEIWAALLADSAAPRIEFLFLDALSKSHDVFGGAFISATDPRVVQALTTQKLNFTRIAETLTEEIRDVLAAHLVGETGSLEVALARKLPELDDGLRRVFGQKEARALAISRTETGHAQNTAEFMQMQEAGVSRVAWVHSGNPNGREDHVALNGVEVPIGQRFSNGLRHPHDPDGDVGQIVNCFAPGTLVTGSFVAGLEALYAGPLVEVVTAKGRRLSVTPNHPVLAEHGWIPAGQIEEGMRLICCGGDIEAGLLRDVDKKNGPAPIEQVLHSLRGVGAETSRVVGALDLHGDARFTTGEVQVVDVLGELVLDGPSPEAQHCAERQLVVADGPGHAGVVSGGGADLLGGGLLSAAGGIPGGGALLLDGGAAGALEAAPVQAARFGHASRIDARASQYARDHGTADAQFLRQLQDADALAVSADRVVSVGKLDWAGHVYDLQSVGGWIVANGIVSSNCGCSLRAIAFEGE